MTDTSQDFPLEQSLGYLLRQSHRLLSRRLEDRIAAYRLTIGSWFFLRVLWEEDGLHQSVLSERAGVMGPTTVAAMERMERQGLITRARDPNDKRRSLVHLTQKGRSMRAELAPVAKEVIAETVSMMTQDEHDELLRLLQKLIGHDQG